MSGKALRADDKAIEAVARAVRLTLAPEQKAIVKGKKINQEALLLVHQEDVQTPTHKYTH